MAVARDELEQHIIESEALGKGESPLRRTPSNSNILLKAVGVRALQSHLESPQHLLPFDTLEVDWPFPQLFSSIEDGLLAFDKGAVYVVGDNGAVSSLDVLSWPNWHLESSIVQGGDPFDDAQWDLTSNASIEGGILYFHNTDSTASQDVGLVEGKRYVLDIHYNTRGPIAFYTDSGYRQLPDSGEHRKREVFEASSSSNLLLKGDDAEVYRVAIRPFNSQPAIFQVSEPWHFIDLGRHWIALSDESVVFTHPDGNIYHYKSGGAPDAGVYHRGRAVFGVSGWNWQEILLYREGLLQEEYPTLGEGSGTDRLFSPGPNKGRVEDGAWVWWSSIGGGDVWYLLDIVSPWQTPYGSTKNTMFHLNDLSLRNESGWIKLPIGTRVLGLVSIENTVVALGDQGISILEQYSSPTPTFGTTRVVGPGIPNRGAFASSQRQIVFVRNDRSVWRFTLEGLEKLGYWNQMEELDLEHLMVVYDSKENEFYICDYDRSFLLTDAGLTEVGQAPTSIWYDQTDLISWGDLVAPLIDTLPGDGKGVRIESNIYDFGTKASKALMFVETLTQDLDEVDVYLKFTGSPTDNVWTTKGPWTIKGRGFTPINIQFCEMQLIIEAPSSDSFSIDAIRLGWQLVGPRTSLGELK